MHTLIRRDSGTRWSIPDAPLFLSFSPPVPLPRFPAKPPKERKKRQRKNRTGANNSNNDRLVWLGWLVSEHAEAKRTLGHSDRLYSGGVGWPYRTWFCFAP